MAVITEFSDTVKVAEVAGQPNELVTVTEIGLSAVVALIVDDVEPFDHEYVVYVPDVLNTAKLPVQ